MSFLIDGVEVPSVEAFEFFRALCDSRAINDQPALAGLACSDRWSIESLIIYSEELERAGFVWIGRAANPCLWTVHAYPHAFEFAERLQEVKAFLRGQRQLQSPRRQSALAL
jgi:hypothetical protein